MLYFFLILQLSIPNSYEIIHYRVHDGDTLVNVIIDREFDLWIVNQKIRFEGFDAWENSRARKTLKLTEEQWKEEIQKGKLAKEDLEQFLAKAKKITFTPTHSKDKDPYNRELGKIFADGIDVGKWMLEKGHSRNVIPGKSGTN